MHSDSLLSIRNLRFHYAREREVLAIDKLDLDAGGLLLVNGPSGSGKSTLLNLIAGVLTAKEGDVRILDQSLGELQSAGRDLFRANHIGYLFQQFNLVPYLSALENICLACRFSPVREKRIIDSGSNHRKEAERLLERLGLSSFESRRPRELSVGQQQRVAAARALIGSPELIIADEPTSALDINARDGFLDLLFAEAKASNTGVIVVSHDRSLEDRFPLTYHLGGDAS